MKVKNDFILISEHTLAELLSQPIKRVMPKIYFKAQEVDIFDMLYSRNFYRGRKKGERYV